mmetsp:Transcript_22190/g.67580  ORF Transcript_22190/g.67580 Transcript_22190/m.67580 type:complete len:204 (-) Transcript_22190:202-813(-)
MAPKRKGKAPSAPTAKAPKADPNKPSDKQLCNILKCFVELCATSYFPDSVHRSSGTLLSTSDGVTLKLGKGAKEFLASLPLTDSSSYCELCADYASAVVSARLQYGDFNLNDGECRWQPVGVHFLPLLVYVETEALAKQWLEVFSDSAECDPEDVGVGGCVENDSECCVIKDYLAELSPKPSSFADYVKAREKLARAARQLQS